jgi:hypothetical protein
MRGKAMGQTVLTLQAVNFIQQKLEFMAISI